MMKKLLVLILITVLATPLMNAQTKFDFSIETRSSDIKGLSKRKLVVELLELNNDAIAEFKKWRGDYPDGEANYRTFIKTYNEHIKTAVAKYWTLNTEIEYKESKEVRKIEEGRNRDILILSAVEVGGTKNYISRFNGTAVMLVLYRSEKGSSEPDYKAMLPYSGSRRDNSNVLTDYLFVVKNAADNFAYMEETKKTSDFVDYMETQVMKNCTTLKDKMLLIDKDLIEEKAEKRDVKDVYTKKKLDIVHHSEIKTAVEAADDAKCYTILIPYGTYQNPFDRELTTYILCYKMIVNASDHKPLHYIEGKAKGSNFTIFSVKDFKQLNECDN